MKKCSVCKKWADNGDKRCRHCGTAFEYDPRKTPFSETKIILALIAIALLVFSITQSLPLKLPDPNVCSRTSYTRFRKIVIRSHTDIMNILAENYISSGQLSKIMQQKRFAESLDVPACLEPAKADFVNYLNTMYYISVMSAWGGYQSAAMTSDQASAYLASLNAHLDAVKACLPNCP